MVKNTRAKNDDMKDVTRKLAHITSIREAQLVAKHADAVVRGYSHTTRRHMDIRAQLRCCKSRKTRFARQPPASALNISPPLLSYKVSRRRSRWRILHRIQNPSFSKSTPSFDSPIDSKFASPPRTTSRLYSLWLNKPSPRTTLKICFISRKVRGCGFIVFRRSPSIVFCIYYWRLIRPSTFTSR